MKLPTLYCLDKKRNVREWSTVVVDQGSYSEIRMSHGLQGMKMIQDSRHVSCGKNIGKKNVTEHYEQACLEAQSLWRKKIDRGYRETTESAEKTILGPMLASKWDKKWFEPCWIQPKLDGMRLLAGRENGALKLYTRMGKNVTSLPHIMKSIEFLQEGEWLDGECFNKKLPFEVMTGLFRRKDPDPEYSHVLQLHVFDTFRLDSPEETFTDRYGRLQQMEFPNNTDLVKVPTFWVEEKTELMKHHWQFTRDGYEGLIVRRRDCLYRMKKRSSDLLKHKDMITEEFVICGAQEGKDRASGTVVWECLSENGTFHVVPKGTVQEKKYWWEHKDEFIGKMLTVQYQRYTQKGLPLFPVGLAIRDYE